MNRSDAESESVRSADDETGAHDRDESGAAAYRRIGRNTLYRSVGEIVAKAASLVFFVVMARKLGADDFGDFSFALSLTTLLLAASGFGTDPLVAREVARERSLVHVYVTNVALIKVLTSVALLGVAELAVTTAGQPASVQVAVLIVGLGVAVEQLGKTWHATLQAFERMEFLSASLIVQRVLTAVVGVAALLGGAGVVAVSCIYLGGAVAGLLFATWANSRYVVRVRAAVDWSRWWPMVRLAMPIGIATLLFSVLLKADAAMIGFLSGGGNNVEVGLFGAAFRPIEATMFLSWAFGGAMLPWLARHDPKRDAPLAHSYEIGLKLTAVVLTPIGVAFVVAAPELIDLLYGEQYAGAVFPLRLLGLVSVLYGINFFTSTVLTARDRPGLFTRALIIVAVQNVVQNVILVPSYGADGAAVTALTSGVILAALSIWQTRSVLGTVRLLRPFGAAAVAGVAMGVAMELDRVALVPSVALGTATYVMALVLSEWLLNRPDFELLRGILGNAMPRRWLARAHR